MQKIFSLKQANKLNLSFSRCSLSTLNKIVGQRSQSLTEEEQVQINEFKRQLGKVLTHDKMMKNFSDRAAKKITRMCLTEDKPISAILNFFFEKCKKGYDERLAAAIIRNLGSLIKSLRLDGELLNGNQRSLEELYKTPQFTDVLDEAKYSLRQGVYISGRNLQSIIQGLGDMDYITDDLMSMAVDKVIRRITGKDNSLVFGQENPQIQRRYYYFGGDLFDREALLQNQNFNKIVEMMQKELDTNEAREERLKELQKQFEKLSPEEQVTEEVQHLFEEVQSARSNIIKYVDAIFAIRAKYSRMCEGLEQTKSALRDPNLNKQLLQIQENLLNLNLITMEQIKSPEILKDPMHNNQFVMKFIKKNLQSGEMNLQFIDKILEQQKEVKLNPKYSDNTEDLIELAVCIRRLADYANIPSAEIEQSGIIQSKWADEILNASSYGGEKLHQKIYCDRIFKKRYHTLVSRIHESLPDILPIYERNPKARLILAGALCSIGLHDQGLRISDVREESIPEDRQSLYYAIEALNTLYNKVDISSVKNVVLSRIQKLHQDQSLYAERFRRPDTGHLQLNIKQLATIANFLENCDLHESQVHKEIVQRLQRKVKFTRELQANPDVGYGLSVLNLDSMPVSAMHPYNFQKTFYNPIIQRVKKTFCDYLNITSNLRDTPYILTGFKKLGENSLSGIIFLPQSVCSLDGKHVDGNVMAYIRRLEKKHNISLEPVPITSFINYDVKTGQIELKPKDVVEPYFKQLVRAEDGPIFKFVDNFSNNLAKIVMISERTWRNVKAVEKIHRTLRRILVQDRLEKAANNQNIAYANRQNTIHLLTDLKKQVKLVDSNRTARLIQNIDQLSGLLLSSLQTIEKSLEKGQDMEFIGRRQSIQSLSAEQPFNTIEFELIDQEFYSNKEYAYYPSWFKRVQDAVGPLNCTTIPLQQCSSITKVMLMRDFQTAKSLSIVPNKIRKFIKTAYPFNWQALKMLTSEEEAKDQKYFEDLVSHPIKTDQQIEGIISIQNFIYELKHGCITDTLELICNLDYMENLMKFHLSEQKQQKVKTFDRYPQQYFDLLRSKSIDHVYESPFLSYFFEKLQKRQHIKTLFEQLEEVKMRGKILLQHQKINYTTYLEMRKKAENAILKHLESFNEDLIDEKVVLGESTLRMYKLEFNKQDMRKVLSRTRVYQLQDDDDVIMAGGDLAEALQTKRYRSEQKLIKCRIIYKLAHQQELSEIEKTFLERWKNGTLPQTMKYDHHLVRELSKRDRQTLTSVAKLPQDLPLTELTFELALFFDDQAINIVEQEKHKQLPAQLYERGSSKASTYFLNQYERGRFDEAAKLTSEDIQNILTTTKMLKVQNPFDRQKYNEIYENAEEQLNTLNQSRSRNIFIAAWYQAKETQFTKNMKPSDLSNMQQTMMSIWKQVTGGQYESMTKEQMENVCTSIIERLFLLKKDQPFYLNRLILMTLMHPQLSKTNKINLLGTLQLLKIPIDIDSDNVKRIAEAREQMPPLSQDQIFDRLRSITKNTLSSLAL